MPGIFITGTGTGVGKTLIGSGIAFCLRAKGVDVGIMKPFATGQKRFSQRYASSDVAILASAAGSSEPDDELNPYFYPVPASPYVAAKLSNGAFPEMNLVLRSAERLLRKHEFLLVEGIGGIMVPLSRRMSLADFAYKLGLPALIVTLPFLGTLNHTLLTVMACRSFGIKVAGIVVNRMPEKPDEATKATPQAILELCGTSNVRTIHQLRSPTSASVAQALEKAQITKLLSMD